MRMEHILLCLILGILCLLCSCEAQRGPRYYQPPSYRPQRYQPPQPRYRPHPADYHHYDDYYDDSWTSASGLHSARPPRREPYYYDDYDYGYDPRPTDYGYDPRPTQKPNPNGRPPRPNSLSMDDMHKEAEKYSGKTRSIADMVDSLQGTYEDKILPQFGDGSTQQGFNLGGVSGMIRGGADMMDGASSFIKKLTNTFGTK